MKLKEVIKYGIQTLRENKIEDDAIKARVLLQHVLKQSNKYLLINSDEEITKNQEEEYKKYINELIHGKPLQYITNNQEFMGINFYVDENVLIPQPDTEILVEEAIKEIEKKIKNMKERDNNYEKIKILDLCTGSGAIAISIAKYLQKYKHSEKTIKIYASDISKEALKIAEKNAKINDVQIKFILSDMFQKIENSPIDKFDIIVSNPPYIKRSVIKELSIEVQSEPHIALDGGADGLDFYRIIAKESNQFLKEKGVIFLEIGYNQKQHVKQIFKTKETTCIKDFAGNDRVIKICTRQPNGDVEL